MLHGFVCYCDCHVIEQNRRGVGKVDTMILEVGGSLAAVSAPLFKDMYNRTYDQADLFQTDPLFDNLKGEPRFKQMMAKVKARTDEMLRRIAADGGVVVSFAGCCWIIREETFLTSVLIPYAEGVTASELPLKLQTQAKLDLP